MPTAQKSTTAHLLLWLGIVCFVVCGSRSAVAADPSARDCIAANERSIELRHTKALLASRDQLRICVATACPVDVRAECERDLNEVTSAIPTLVLGAKDARGNDLVDVTVTLDGQPWLDHLDGSARMLDPGPHAIVLSVAGEAPIHKDIVVGEGQHDRREVVRFPSALSRSRPRREPVRRALGLITGGAGLLSLGVGLVSGALAASLWSNSQSECNDATHVCDQYALSVGDYATANQWATVSTVTSIVGGALFAVGGVLFFTAPYIVRGKMTGIGIAVGGRL